jgi:hypothetical protein
MTPVDQARQNISKAQQWINSATGALNTIIGFNGKREDIAKLPQFQAVVTHFHITLGPPPSFLRLLATLLPIPGFEADPTLALLKDVRFQYFDISRGLNHANYLNATATGEGDNATAYVPMVRDGTLRITPYFLNLGPMMQLKTLVHEGAHFVSDEFQDWAYRDRRGEEEPNKYRDLPIQFAIRNADSYAYFALQMATGISRIIENSE